MIKCPEDPRQMYFVCRAELVADEPLVRTVGQAVDRLDLEALYDRYSEGGRSFYDPAMLLKVWFFAYRDGVRSSREVVKRIKYDIKVRSEFLLMCIAHILKKMAAYGGLLRPVPTAALKAAQTALIWLLRLYQHLPSALRIDVGHFNARCQTAA